jgi:hypothetical protein
MKMVGSFENKLVRGIGWVGFFAVSAIGGFGLGSIDYKSEHIPLTDRLEQSYQACQKIENKDEPRNDLSLSSGTYYITCREVEDLYLKVNPK